MVKTDDLKKYTWGLGIEHEMHLFHIPKKSKNNIKDVTVFNSYDVVTKILEEKENSISNLSYDDYIFLKNKVPFEISGRRCNGKWVIESVPVKMPEFITFDPFCSIEKDRDIKNMTMDIVEEKNRFYRILMNNKETQKLIKKYGDLGEHPFGMTRYLKCPLDIKKNSYIFEKDKNGNPVLLPEYNGSYHVTLTLPHKENISNAKFIKMHQNFCNQLQWLEPLLLTAYFTGDEYAPGSLKDRVRGSFRVMIIGWGNLAGTDIRLLDKGIGRYAKTPTYWRKDLKFKDVEKLRPCYEPSPMALKEKALTSLSSDFRTFGSTDQSRPMHRESGVGMTKPNGVEFRIFDHFPDRYIDHLLQLIALVAENSRVTETKGYVYQNKIWIKELHNIMQNGYKAQISTKYINLLRNKLGLKIETTSIIAIDIFKQIYRELCNKNKNGDWTKIFNSLNIPDYSEFNCPDVNKNGWKFAFMMKLNNNPILMAKLNRLTSYLNENKNVSFAKFKVEIIRLFGLKWSDDIVDIAYFYESNDILNSNNVVLNKNANGTIKSINIMNNIPKYINFNDDIINYFREDTSNI